jgi:glucokinase-like ROK family protein
MANRTPQRRSGQGGTPGELLQLIRRGEATTRTALAEATGLARSTVSQRIDQLITDGLVTEVGEAPSTGGRPPAVLGFNHDAGVVLVADLGATHSRLAVSDLAGRPLTEVSVDLDIAAGPEHVLGVVEKRFIDLLDEAGRPADAVRAVGLGVPGPVEFAAGRAVNPPIMPGWDGYPIRDRFHDDYSVPVLVDNDVNIMALGEHWVMSPPPDDLLFIKVGTGIGSGLILGGRLHRGAQGAAGDIGHVQVAAEPILCRCGNQGCLEAVAGGRALAHRLSEQGLGTVTSRDVVRLAKDGDATATQAIREGGRLIGRVLASMVNILNPDTIVVGGDMADAGEQLLAGVREVVYKRSTALATSRLQVLSSTLGDRAGITGAAAMVIEHVFAPRMIDASLAGRAARLSRSGGPR